MPRLEFGGGPLPDLRRGAPALFVGAGGRAPSLSSAIVALTSPSFFSSATLIFSLPFGDATASATGVEGSAADHRKSKAAAPQKTPMQVQQQLQREADAAAAKPIAGEAVASACVASGRGLQTAVVKQLAQFVVTAHDAHGRRRHAGGDPFSVLVRSVLPPSVPEMRQLKHALQESIARVEHATHAPALRASLPRAERDRSALSRFTPLPPTPAPGGPPAEHAVVANFTVVCRWCVWAELQLLPKDYTHCR